MRVVTFVVKYKGFTNDCDDTRLTSFSAAGQPGNVIILPARPYPKKHERHEDHPFMPFADSVASPCVRGNKQLTPIGKHVYTFKKENSWRRLQSDFLETRRKRQWLKRFLKISAVFGILALMMSGLTWVLDFNALFDQGKTAPTTRVEAAIPPKPLSKPALKALIRHTHFLNANRDTFFVDTPEESYCIQTGLNPGLQEFLTTRLDRLKALKRGKPQRIAMVVLDGRTGFILAMAGFDLDDPKANPCTAADYPAASIFKLVTAAASIDALGYTPHTPLYFNGNKYTLYKRQLTDKRNRYTVQTTLAKAFAQSINPVFGKLGQTHLGRERLNTYAHAFGFNQTPDTEFNFPEARFSVTESGYHLAELGCGFNRQTTISPLFAATMVTAMLNQGSSLMPRIVNQVKLSNGNVIYKSTKAVYKTPIAPKTAQAMVQIMKQTVARGTAKKSFRGFSRDKVLSGLVIGGKTGSLSNAEHTVKYDWFTGFGKEKNGSRAVAVAVVVGHRKYIGTRASTHAKAILKTYFSSLTNKKAPLPGQQAGQQQG